MTPIEKIETPRLLITRFRMNMAEAVHLNSLDADTRRSCLTRYLKRWMRRRKRWNF